MSAISQSHKALEGILARVAAGEAGAMAELYDATSGMVYSLAERLLRDPFQAEETVLDVYRYAWESAQRFDPRRGSVNVWLLSITRGRSIDRLRSTANRRHRERSLSDCLGPDSSGSEPSAFHGKNTPGDFESKSENDPAEKLLAEENQDALARALEALPYSQRRVIELAFFHGMTHQMIAQETKEPLGTIKSQIRRGLLRLHDLLTASENEGQKR